MDEGPGDEDPGDEDPGESDYEDPGDKSTASVVPGGHPSNY